MAFDDREKSWYNGRNFVTPNNGVQFSLKGEPGEFFVSWPGRDYNLQNFIENNVHVHQKINIKNGMLIYDSNEITKLKRANQGLVNNSGSFRVSNIMRYQCGEYFKTNSPKFYNSLCPEVKRRGWFYLPLVEQV